MRVGPTRLPRRSSLLTLYHLGISHFSEKVRWALAYKKLEYRSRLLTPGFHKLTTRRIAGSSTVPVLVDDDTGTAVAESTDILHYLDRIRPDPPLFPADASLATAVVEVEDLIDVGWGPNASAFAYCHLVESPGDLRRRWSTGLNVLQRGLLFAAMPVLVPGLRRMRQLSLENASEYRAAAMRTFDDVEARLIDNGEEYLVGGSFTAADLTGAALLGPFVRAPGSPWEENDATPSPSELQALRDELRSRTLGQWALRMWDRHRH